MYVLAVFGLFACLFVFVCLVFLSVTLHYFSHLLDCWSKRQQWWFASSLFPCDRTTEYCILFTTFPSLAICFKHSKKITHQSGMTWRQKKVKDRIWWFNFSTGIFLFQWCSISLCCFILYFGNSFSKAAVFLNCYY